MEKISTTFSNDETFFVESSFAAVCEFTKFANFKFEKKLSKKKFKKSSKKKMKF